MGHQRFAVPAASSRDSNTMTVPGGSSMFSVYINSDQDVTVEVFRVGFDLELRSQMEMTPEPLVAPDQLKLVFYENADAVVVRVTNAGLVAADVTVEIVAGGAS